MLRFQRDTLCFRLVTYLLAVSLGLGDWKLCVRNGGQLPLHSEYSQALKCKLFSLSHRDSSHTHIVDTKPAANCSCGGCGCCFEVTLIMVPSPRGTRLIQGSLTSSMGHRCPLCETVSGLLLYSGRCPPIRLGSPLFYPYFESLRSTVLLI